MEEDLRQAIAGVVQNLYGLDGSPVLTRPEEQFGDYATNVALQLSKQVGQNPRDIAEALSEQLRTNLTDTVSEISVAGPGFINFKLNDQVLSASLNLQPAKNLTGQTWVVEYSCPNAFKELHVGHLYNTIAGDILARLVEQAGAKVDRTSFGGDVGLHVGKSLWGILQAIGGERPDQLNEVSDDPIARANWLSECYVAGAAAYEDDETAKQAIIELNKAVYKIHETDDNESPLSQIYWQCRQWSYDYFEAFYQLIKVDTMRYYPESETTDRGLAVVKEQLAAGKLEESDGAVVFKGNEDEGLHIRVFITKNGLPTYETKDVGVILAEQNDYNFDHRLLLTGNDQTEYMKVVFAAMDSFFPGIAAKMTHRTNGTVRFGDGQKMSSRLGNVSRALDVLTIVKDRTAQIVKDTAIIDDVSLGAIKYEFAKHRLGGDIAFDLNESVSLEGNSGPYLQYAHARARSILNKAEAVVSKIPEGIDFTNGERSLVRKIGEYAGSVDRAVADLMPHHICTYLYELAQTFNRFYEKNRVIGDERQELRLALVEQYANTLEAGLSILGIVSPDKM